VTESERAAPAARYLKGLRRARWLACALVLLAVALTVGAAVGAHERETTIDLVIELSNMDEYVEVLLEGECGDVDTPLRVGRDDAPRRFSVGRVPEDCRVTFAVWNDTDGVYSWGIRMIDGHTDRTVFESTAGVKEKSRPRGAPPIHGAVGRVTVYADGRLAALPDTLLGDNGGQEFPIRLTDFSEDQ
jgi:hypothetical protein